MTESKERRLPPLYDPWFIILMALLVLFSVVLGITGLEKQIAFKVEPLLPDWFPTFNMVAAPILAALPTTLRMRVELRFFLLVLVLCSFSLYRLSFDKHPAATLIIALFIYVELFWLIPKWNRRHNATGSANWSAP